MKKLMFVLMVSFAMTNTAFAGGLAGDIIDALTPEPACQAVKGGINMVNNCASAIDAYECGEIGINACVWTEARYSCKFDTTDFEEQQALLEDGFDCSANLSPRECRGPWAGKYCSWK